MNTKNQIPQGSLWKSKGVGARVIVYVATPFNVEFFFPQNPNRIKKLKRSVFLWAYERDHMREKAHEGDNRICR